MNKNFILGISTAVLLSSSSSQLFSAPQQQQQQKYGLRLTAEEQAQDNVYIQRNRDNSQMSTNQTQADFNISNSVSTVVHSAWLSKGDQQLSFSVSNGMVVLKGTLNNEADKQRVEDSVRRIPGVKTIDNQITIASGDTAMTDDDDQQVQLSPADQEVYNKVKDALKPGIISKGYPKVSYSVKDGLVVLSGAVNTADEKVKVQDAVKKIKGVREVQSTVQVVNGKTALTDAADLQAKQIQQEQAAETDADKKLDKRIYEKLGKSYKNITITSSKGFVTVSGTVGLADDINNVQSSIKSVSGVKGVNNRLSVAP